MIDCLDLNWRRIPNGFALHLGKSRNPLLNVTPDGRWPQMWRIRHRDNSLSDLLNLARAKDAAQSNALAELRAQEVGKRPLLGAPKRFSGEQLPTRNRGIRRTPCAAIQLSNDQRSVLMRRKIGSPAGIQTLAQLRQTNRRLDQVRRDVDRILAEMGKGASLMLHYENGHPNLATDLRPFRLVKGCRDRDHDPCRRRCRR